MFGIRPSAYGCQAHLYTDDAIVYCFADSVQLVVENLQLSFLQEVLIYVKIGKCKQNKMYGFLKIQKHWLLWSTYLYCQWMEVLKELQNKSILASDSMTNSHLNTTSEILLANHN